MPTVELFAEDEDGTQQRQDGTSGIDGRSNGDGEVLQPIVGTYPGSQNDGRLEDDVEVYDGVLDTGNVEEAVTVDMSGGREYHEGQEDAGTEESVEQQDRNDGIVLETYLLEYIIDAQEHGAQKGKENPHSLVRCAHANIRCAHVNTHFVRVNTDVLILAGARVNVRCAHGNVHFVHVNTRVARAKSSKTALKVRYAHANSNTLKLKEVVLVANNMRSC